MLCDLLAGAGWLCLGWDEDMWPQWAVDIGNLPDEDRRQAVAALPPERVAELNKVRAEYERQRDAWNRDELLLMASGCMPEAGGDAFRKMLAAAQKFNLTASFADATLERLATAEASVRAKDFFRLTHDPMWLEWSHTSIAGKKLGALLFAEPDGWVGAYVSWLGRVPGAGRMASVQRIRFKPDTLRVEDGEVTVDWDLVDGNPSDEIQVKHDDGTIDTGPRAVFVVGKLAIDFVIRINSPRITDVEPGEDLSALNRKRERAGKPPLFSYHVVDLNERIKADLRAAADLGDEREGTGRRLHWRRGHFKARKNGLFWWNPHLAGKAEAGVVEKEYAA